MKRFIGLTVLVLFILTPMLPASAYIAQHHNDCSATVSPTLNAAKQQLNAPQAQFERPEGIHPERAVERSRRLLPTSWNASEQNRRTQGTARWYKFYRFDPGL
jgi:hypothetical protein